VANGPEQALTELVPTVVGYDRWAETYDAERNPLVLLEERYVGPLIGDVAGLEVVDIGCGTGRHSLRLAAAGAHVTAVDFSEAMLARARQKPGAQRVRFLHHDLAEPLPLADESCDRVFCFLVIEHIRDLDRFFAELRRLCRPDGRVLLSAMHPAMFLKGTQAGFTDPASGRKVCPESHPQQISDYLMAATRAGLSLDAMSERSVDDELTRQAPRVQKYLGWPLLLLMRFARG
jgi:malonyl-CoA O-methyltransferase